MRQLNSIHLIERIIACATYLTSGLAGFIWLVISILIKKRPTQFILYHTFQSIFLYIAFFIFFELYKLVYIIIAKVPLLNAVMFIFNNIINSPITLFFGLSLLQAITTSLLLYLSITAFIGQYSYIPKVSDIINTNIGRR